MFSLKNKINPELKQVINENLYKNYRVLIKCKHLQKNIESKISSYKGTLIRSFSYCDIICAYVNARAIERLIEYPEVEYITLDSFAFLCGKSIQVANGVHFSERYKLSGKGIGIAIIDTGVYPHPDLLNPRNKIKLFVDLIKELKHPYDDNGHGTFIAGLIAGSGFSSREVYRGIAENSDLYCYKAFNSLGRAYISDIFYSIEDVISKSKEFNIKVLCLPFETVEHNFFVKQCFSKLFNDCIKNNIIPVVPSGSNEYKEGSIVGMASLPNCITVAGLDTTNMTKDYIFSSSGPLGKLDKPDLSAACVDICSLNCNTSYVSERNGMKLYPQTLKEAYTSYSGTSCAAAYVSGLCALLLENKPDLSFKDLISLIKISCNMLDIPKGIQGNGMVDLNKLLP